jgi:probable HAF family extracellular repeat protein
VDAIHKQIATCAALFSLLSTELAFGADWLLLDDLPGGEHYSLGLGISNHGEFIAGSSRSAASELDNNLNTEAFIWSADTGMSGLGDLAGGEFDSWAYDISRDGAAIAGYGRFGPGGNDIQATRWTAAAGMVGLGGLNASGVSLATAISGDGNVVVGGAISNAGTQAFRWDAVNGMTGLGFFPGGNAYSYARGTNHDGTIIVGSASPSTGTEAFIWTEQDGYTGLGDLSGGSIFSAAYGVSDDGSVVVGGSSDTNSGAQRTPFRWTSSTGMTGLGDLPGGAYAGYALALSADGEVVVGFAESAHGKEGFVWTAATGMVGLTDYMTNLGVELNGLFLGPAYDVSPDGRFASGSMLNDAGQEEAYRVDLQPLLVAIDFDVWSSANEFSPNEAYFTTLGVKTMSIADGDNVDFDAVQVDPDTLRIGPAGAPNLAQPLTRDIDADGDIDLVFGFRTEQSGVTCTDTEISVEGKTYNGEPFVGDDLINTTGCETNACHP